MSNNSKIDPLFKSAVDARAVNRYKKASDERKLKLIRDIVAQASKQQNA
jgi:hypothetical protein